MSTIKLTADSGSGTVSIKAPSSTGSNGHREFTLPDTYSGNGSLVTADSSGKILINTSSSREIGGGNAKLQIENTNTESISITRTSADGGSPYLHFGKTRNGSVVQSGDSLGSIAFNGDDGTDLNHAGAEIRAFVDGTPGSNDMPGRLAFYTTADGASTTTERVRLTAKGFLKCKGDYSGYYNVGSAEHEFNADSGGATTVNIRAGSSNGNGIKCLVNSSDSTNYFLGGYSLSADAWKAYVWSNGDLENAGNNYGGISDIKLKENIVDAKSQWNDIKNFKVRNFNFKDNPSQPMLGLIAQEAETVSPGLVYSRPDLDKDGKELGTTTKALKYSVLYMKAIKALQEAMAKIETLETKVAALEAK